MTMKPTGKRAAGQSTPMLRAAVMDQPYIAGGGPRRDPPNHGPRWEGTGIYAPNFGRRPRSDITSEQNNVFQCHRGITKIETGKL